MAKSIRTAFLVGLILTTAIQLTAGAGRASAESHALAIKNKNCQVASAYSAKAGGYSMLVIEDGKVVFEDYPNGHKASEPHELASGTKSFTGLCALAASEDGILTLDEKVSDTIIEWKGDPKREAITIRELLSLISGIESPKGGISAPTYADAISCPVTAKPGEKFQYGPAPFQIFGELMVRKLKANKDTKEPHATMVDYLQRRVLNPADIHVGLWRKGRDGMPLMPQGAALTAREWSKVGQFVLNGGKAKGKQIIQSENLKSLFVGSPANPMYGISWWLYRPMDDQLRSSIRTLTMASDLRYGAPGVPNDLVMAAGAGKQRLYVVPSMRLIVVRQADIKSELMPGQNSTKFSDIAFWQLLTLGQAEPQAPSGRSRRLPGLRSGAGSSRLGGAGQASFGQASSGQASSGQGKRFMRLLDRNHDGTLDEQERQNFRNFLQKRKSGSAQ